MSGAAALRPLRATHTFASSMAPHTTRPRAHHSIASR